MVKKILNPETGRMVNLTGKIGQKVFFPTLEGNIITGKLVKPNFFDPNGDRLNGI